MSERHAPRSGFCHCEADELQDKDHWKVCPETIVRERIAQMEGPKEPRIEIRETFMKPTVDWPEGGYLREVGGQVEMATGYYATIYPDKPSPYLGGKPPIVMMWDRGDWPW